MCVNGQNLVWGIPFVFQREKYKKKDSTDESAIIKKKKQKPNNKVAMLRK